MNRCCKIEVKIIRFLLAGLFFGPFYSGAQNAGAADRKSESDSARLYKRESYISDNQKFGKLDLLIDSIVIGFMQSPQNCGMSIGVSKDGVNYFYNYGEVQKDSKKMPARSTIYEIGSLTTTFCGILLAKAVEEGKVKLEDDIRMYLPGKYPDLAYKNGPIRIKHLANHTSGLPAIPGNLKITEGYDSLNPYAHYKKHHLFDYLQTIVLNDLPGTGYDYSVLGIGLLGVIIETVYDKSFEELVREKICVPNNMLYTSVNLSSQQEQSFANGYNLDGDNTPHWNLGVMAGAGGLKSTSQDMLTYLNYNLAENDPAAKLTHKPTFTVRQSTGLAWFIKRTKQGNTLVWQNGGTFGFSAFMGFIKEKNCSVVVLANSATPVDYIAIAILNYLQQ